MRLRVPLSELGVSVCESESGGAPAGKSNNQKGSRKIKQSKSHEYHFPIPLVFIIKTIKIPGKSREKENTGHPQCHRERLRRDAHTEARRRRPQSAVAQPQRQMLEPSQMATLTTHCATERRVLCGEERPHTQTHGSRLKKNSRRSLASLSVGV